MILVINNLYDICNRSAIKLENLNTSNYVLSNYELGQLNAFAHMTFMLNIIVDTKNINLLSNFKTNLFSKVDKLQKTYDLENCLSSYELGQLNAFSNILTILDSLS